MVCAPSFIATTHIHQQPHTFTNNHTHPPATTHIHQPTRQIYLSIHPNKHQPPVHRGITPFGQRKKSMEKMRLKGGRSKKASEGAKNNPSVDFAVGSQVDTFSPRHASPRHTSPHHTSSIVSCTCLFVPIPSTPSLFTQQHQPHHD